jgi:hypothetical protein
MRTRAILVTFLMTFALVAGSQAAELEVRVFTLKHKTPAEASQEIQSLLSAQGSLTVKPGAKSLTVQDRPDVVKQVADFLETYDVAPPEFGIRLSLMLATNTKPKEGDTTEIAEGLLWRLRRMYRYQYFVLRGSSVVHGQVGSEVTVKLTDAYSVVFGSQQIARAASPAKVRVRPLPQSIQKPGGTERRAVPQFGRGIVQRSRLRLEHLTLTKTQQSQDGAVHRQEVLRTSVNLSSGQRVVLGAASSEAAGSAVVLVVEALPEEEK